MQWENKQKPFTATAMCVYKCSVRNHVKQDGGIYIYLPPLFGSVQQSYYSLQ